MDDVFYFLRYINTDTYKRYAVMDVENEVALCLCCNKDFHFKEMKYQDVKNFYEEHVFLAIINNYYIFRCKNPSNISMLDGDFNEF